MRGVAFKTVLDGIFEEASIVTVREARRAQVTGFINQALDVAYPWLEDGWPELREATLETVVDQVISPAVVDDGGFGTSRVLGVTVEHPWKSANPRPVAYTETGEGIVILEGEGQGAETLWVAHIQQPPVFSSVAWATVTAYTQGQMRLQGEECYFCKEDHTSGTFATDLAAGKWAVKQVPGFLNVPVRAAVAEYLKRSSGQEQTAMTLAGLVRRRLDEVAMRYR